MDTAGLIAHVRALGITGIAPPKSATPTDVCVVWDPRALRGGWGDPGLIVAPPSLSVPRDARVVHTPAPEAAFAALVAAFHPEPEAQPGIHPTAWVHPDASVHTSSTLGPLVVVEAGAVVGPSSVLRARSYVGREARLGTGCLLEAGALVLDRCILGDGVWIGPGSAIGGRGFGYQRPQDGVRAPIAQVGRVVIGAGTHIGSLCAVDRGTLGDTTIGSNVRIDNHVVIGHNAQIGDSAVLVSQVGVSGSATVGAGAVLAAGAGVTDHRRVGAGAVITARASVYRDVPDGATYSGSPARPRAREMKEQAAIRRVARASLRASAGDTSHES